MNTRKVAVRMSQTQVVAMHKLLSEHIRLLPKANPNDPQLVEYEEGWDDDRIGKTIDPKFGAVHASNLRSNVFGRLFVKGTIPNKGDDIRVDALLAANNEKTVRINQLEQQMGAVMEALHDLTIKHNKLCNGLSLARVIDARHLGRDVPHKQ